MIGEELVLDERSVVGVRLVGGGFGPVNVVDLDETVLGVLAVRTLEPFDVSIKYVGLPARTFKQDDAVRFLADGLHYEVMDEEFHLLVEVVGDFVDGFRVGTSRSSGLLEVLRKISDLISSRVSFVIPTASKMASSISSERTSRRCWRLNSCFRHS